MLRNAFALPSLEVELNLGLIWCFSLLLCKHFQILLSDLVIGQSCFLLGINGIHTCDLQKKKVAWMVFGRFI